MKPVYQPRIASALLSVVVGSTIAMGAEPNLPVTAKDHLALAEQYDRKAAVYREEAAQHQAMVKAAYKAEIHSKAPIRRKFEQMRRHCAPMIRDAEKLARDTDAFADWHRVQAAELQRQRGTDAAQR